MKTARDWKAFYARERERLGETGLQACLARAETLGLPDALAAAGGAVVFPHTRLETSGELAAAAALAALRSGCETVLALGVLHGAREEDAALVSAARSGDARARAALRKVHGPGVPGDGGNWGEEFSLDGFCALLEAAARRDGVRPLQVICRYPFLVGENPADLPGIDELRTVHGRGAFLVATADPMHHGVGYDTPPAECRPHDQPGTKRWARTGVEEGFELLAAHDYGGFLRHAAAVKSDFRDPGPVLARLLVGGLRATVHDLRLVDYVDVLDAPAPTWVAGALATFCAV